MDDRFVRPAVDREVEEEIAFHVEMRVRELVAGGMDEEQARLEATHRIGDVEHVKARMRHEGRRREGRMSRRRWWDETRQDLAFASRQLRRAPGFAALAIVTLALAIGASTAVFGVVNGVLLRPLPYERPDEVALLWSRYLPPSGFDLPRFPLSGPEILDYREATRVFARFGVFQDGGSRALTGDGQDAERVPVTFVSADVFPVLGVRPWIGRWFSPEEDAPAGPDVTVLGWELWTTRFGADSTLVGRTILMNGVPTEVVGVMPDGFRIAAAERAWLPLGLDRSNEGGRGSHGYTGVGRLAPGRTLTDAEAELEVVKQQWAAEYPHNVAHFAWAQGIEDAVLGDAPRTLFLLLSAVALVLLVACANVANLLLARGERRQSEVAVRTALGAGTSRLTRQLVTESLVLAGAASVLGLGLARLLTPSMIALAPTALPRLEGVRVDGTVVAFSLATALLTALLFGVVPSLLTGRRALARAAAAGARAVGGRRARSLRGFLVTAEVAVSLVVVVLAGLLVRSFTSLSSTEPGLAASNVLTFAITLPPAAYPESALVAEEHAGLVARIRAVPGVAAASGGTTLPFQGGYGQWDFQLDDRPPRQEGDRAWNAGIAWVQAGFFETLGIPLLAGRGIEPTDDAGAALVAVVSEAMARTYWPDLATSESGLRGVLGKRFGYASADGGVPWNTIVGVARDQRYIGLDEEPYPFVWLPHRQAQAATGGTPRTLRIAVRTARPPEALARSLRAAVADFDPDLPLSDVRTLEDAVTGTLARPRLATSLLGAFALLAAVLAAVGIYGVISYSVAGRTREIGVRMALGAGRSDVMRLVVGEGARPVVLGVAIGLTVAWFATGLVEAMLFGVTARDPLTFSALPAGLIAVGLAASALPALRATRIPPTESLRAD